MFHLLSPLAGLCRRCFCSRKDLLLENLVLRQQLAVFKRRKQRPTLGGFDKLFWVTVQHRWNGWKESLLIVTPDTVARLHRAGFRKYLR